MLMLMLMPIPRDDQRPATSATTGQCRRPTSDRPRKRAPTAAAAAKRRAAPPRRPAPIRTALYGAQSHRRSHARNPALAHTHPPMRRCATRLCLRTRPCLSLPRLHTVLVLRICACTRHFTGFALLRPASLCLLRCACGPLDASLALFCALCKLTNDKK